MLRLYSRSILLVALLSGCSNKEERARTLLNEAITLQRESKPGEYEKKLTLIVNSYPSTVTGTEANQLLSLAERADRERRKFAVSTVHLISTCQFTHYTEREGKFAAGTAALAQTCPEPSILMGSNGYTFRTASLDEGREFTIQALSERADDPFFYLDSKEMKIHSEIGRPATAQSPVFAEK